MNKKHKCVSFHFYYFNQFYAFSKDIEILTLWNFFPLLCFSLLRYVTRYFIDLFSNTRGPFLERPGNLTGPKSHFEIKVLRKVGYVLTSNEVHFVSLADNFTVQFSNLLKLPSAMQNRTA